MGAGERRPQLSVKGKEKEKKRKENFSIKHKGDFVDRFWLGWKGEEEEEEEREDPD